MKNIFNSIALVLVILCCFSAQAVDLRVIILPKTTIDGKTLEDSSSIETEVASILTEKNMRIIELSTALKAQKAALSDLVTEGKVPTELSVLNADALVSTQLACDKSSDSIMGSNIKSWFCVLNTKVIRVDSGDVIFADSKNYTAAGLNALQAVNTAVKKNIKKNVVAGVEQWSKNWSNEGKWNMDIIITGVAQKTKIEEINKEFKKIDGVKSSAIVMFKKDFSKISISGEGSENYSKLREAIDTSGKLSLKVNYEAGRVIHAEFDFGQAYSKDAAAYITPPKSEGKKSMAELIASKGPDLLTSYLMNLEYLEIKESETLKGSKDSMVSKAKKEGVPVVVFVEVVEKENQWLSVIELVTSKDNKKIVVAKGTADDPFEAMDKAIRTMDSTYRRSMTKPNFRKSLNLTKEAAGIADSMKLSVDKFDVGQIFPSLVPYYREKGVGSITLKNISSETLKNIEITYKIGEKVIGTAKVDDIAPKSTAVSSIKPDTIPEGNSEYAQLSAKITFTAGESYGSKDAFAPLVIHSKNTIDWSNPMTVASFVDPENKTVRELATRAVKNGAPKELATKQVGNAALIFSSLWHKPLKYVSDPVSTSFDSNIDTVQFPAETIARGAGDCDDLTVLLASLFESVGLATVIITSPGHVFLGVESGALAGGNVIFNLPDSLFVEVDGALFVPVEATAIDSTFAEAWLKAADIVKKSANDISAFRTREAWKAYPVISVTTNKMSLNFKEPESSKVKNTLSEIQKMSEKKAPAWAEEIYKGKITQKNPNIKAETLSKTPIAKSVVLWLTGNREASITQAADLCSKSVVEGCYNMTVMSMYDALEKNDLQTIDVNMNKDNYSEAVAMLPPNVVNMLSDNGGLGMGDEASKESETRKKIADILKKAREKAGKQSKGATTSKEIKTSHVGGRKASDSASETSATAEMFFWDKIKK
ncbi:MAG: hypothetical protein ACOX2F_07890 [bacterium]